jgi:hypothetical protein
MEADPHRDMRHHTFPCFTNTEIRKMHAAAYPEVSNHDVNTRLAFWGPVPLWVFGSTPGNQQCQLDEVTRFNQVDAAAIIAGSYHVTHATRHTILFQHALGEQEQLKYTDYDYYQLLST